MLAFLAEAFETITLGAIVFGGHLSRVKMSGGAIFLGSNCQGGNNPEGNHPGGNCPGAII